MYNNNKVMNKIIIYTTNDGMYYTFCIFIAWYLSQRGNKVKFIKDNNYFYYLVNYIFLN